MKSPKSGPIFSPQIAPKRAAHVLPGATSAPSCSRSRQTRRRRAPRPSLDGGHYDFDFELELVSAKLCTSPARGDVRAQCRTHGRACRHVHAPRCGGRAREIGAICEYVAFPAVCPPKSHETAEKWPYVFCSDRTQTRRVHAPQCDEHTVGSTKPSDVASTRTVAIRASERGGTTRGRTATHNGVCIQHAWGRPR